MSTEQKHFVHEPEPPVQIRFVVKTGGKSTYVVTTDKPVTESEAMAVEEKLQAALDAGGVLVLGDGWTVKEITSIFPRLKGT